MIKISFQRKCFLHPFIESNYFPCFKHEHLTLFIDIIEDYVFGEKYKIVPPGNTRITWEQARKNCQTMGHGWDLLKIQSRAEDLIIKEMLKCELRGNIKSTYDNFYYQRFCFVIGFLASSLKMITSAAKLKGLFFNKPFDKHNILYHNYDWFFCEGIWYGQIPAP